MHSWMIFWKDHSHNFYKEKQVSYFKATITYHKGLSGEQGQPGQTICHMRCSHTLKKCKKYIRAHWIFDLWVWGDYLTSNITVSDLFCYWHMQNWYPTQTFASNLPLHHLTIITSRYPSKYDRSPINPASFMWFLVKIKHNQHCMNEVQYHPS